MATIDTDELFAKAEELQDRKVALLDEMRANRETLRNLVVQGFVKGREASRVDEIYPPRRRGEELEENGAAA